MTFVLHSRLSMFICIQVPLQYKLYVLSYDSNKYKIKHKLRFSSQFIDLAMDTLTT